METIESLRQRIESAEDLQSVVKTMKALAAVSIRHYERAAASLEDYNRTIEMGLHIVLHNRPKGVTVPEAHLTGRLGAVVFGSDQGMCGQFNERIATYTLDRMNGMHIRHQDRSILSVGLRVTARLEEAHQPIERDFTLPGSVSGITPAVQELLLHIEKWRDEQDIDQVVLFHNKPISGATYRPQMVHLWPLDLVWLRGLEREPWPSRVLPFFRMEWNELFAALIRQHFSVAVFRAFTESLASENASRLASMQAAERNIREKLEALNGQYHQQRQSSITSELLDIMAGFEALANEKRRARPGCGL